MGDFWATVHVKFFVPQDNVDGEDGTPFQGYYQHLGIRAKPERVQEVIGSAFPDGWIKWDETEWGLVDPAGLDKAIRSRIEPIAGEGIWYRSGRRIYSDPDLEPPVS